MFSWHRLVHLLLVTSSWLPTACRNSLQRDPIRKTHLVAVQLKETNFHPSPATRCYHHGSAQVIFLTYPGYQPLALTANQSSKTLTTRNKEVHETKRGW
ncbi:hypothetical protein B0T09DRAFT_17099 [Sordaria sp. MPI-SDFR-AT-0083]|nr:hypothetical protein B0T09DRAFT_17099 [Sordaria sp. MPI-SDFR-AT-0083]